MLQRLLLYVMLVQNSRLGCFAMTRTSSTGRQCHARDAYWFDPLLWNHAMNAHKFKPVQLISWASHLSYDIPYLMQVQQGPCHAKGL
jgi:hypothetical protein